MYLSRQDERHTGSEQQIMFTPPPPPQKKPSCFQSVSLWNIALIYNRRLRCRDRLVVN